MGLLSTVRPTNIKRYCEAQLRSLQLNTAPKQPCFVTEVISRVNDCQQLDGDNFRQDLLCCCRRALAVSKLCSFYRGHSPINPFFPSPGVRCTGPMPTNQFTSATRRFCGTCFSAPLLAERSEIMADSAKISEAM